MLCHVMLLKKYLAFEKEKKVKVKVKLKLKLKVKEYEMHLNYNFLIHYYLNVRNTTIIKYVKH